MVSAWASQNRVVLGQVKVDEKSNEITAIPVLLEMLAISGCIVTIDAMGCQKDIATKVIDKKAHYLLALKDNQPKLYEAVQALFAKVQQGTLTPQGFPRKKLSQTSEQENLRLEPSTACLSTLDSNLTSN